LEQRTLKLSSPLSLTTVPFFHFSLPFRSPWFQNNISNMTRCSKLWLQDVWEGLPKKEKRLERSIKYLRK
jgi:hypothetical protein